RTDFPPPLRPIITSVSPTATSSSTPRKIFSSPMALCKSRTTILAPLLVGGDLSLVGMINANLSLNRQQSTYVCRYSTCCSCRRHWRQIIRGAQSPQFHLEMANLSVLRIITLEYSI